MSETAVLVLVQMERERESEDDDGVVSAFWEGEMMSTRENE